jgi:hypothetical protein
MSVAFNAWINDAQALLGNKLVVIAAKISPYFLSIGNPEKGEAAWCLVPGSPGCNAPGSIDSVAWQEHWHCCWLA